MSSLSYISIIDRYHEYREAIQELLGSILSGIGSAKMFSTPDELRNALCTIREHYPFVDLIYALDCEGVQISSNVGCQKKKIMTSTGLGMDRSQRPYFLLASQSANTIVTEPYLSSASRALCISAALRYADVDKQVLGYIVLDIDLSKTIEHFMGDASRRRFAPIFRSVYSVIVIGLFMVVGILLFAAYREVVHLFMHSQSDIDLHLSPFGIIIFLTLALAVFDLGKTIFEEEVLMHKDIFRHSSTRRTITRFVAAILIAVSIEALLMMFKSAIGGDDHMIEAVLMMSTAVGLLIGLGIYVFLGAHAEVKLRGSRTPIK